MNPCQASLTSGISLQAWGWSLPVLDLEVLMAEVFGRTVRLVRGVEISLHHPTARGRAFDDLARC